MQPPGVFHTVAGRRTHVVVDGQGPPLLYLAALGGNWFDFDHVTALIDDRWTVIRYDRPGYGFSEPLPRGEIPSLADEVDRIDGVLDALGVTEPVVVVAHSMASLYAEAYARCRPDRVAGVIMLDGSYALVPLHLMPPEWSNRLAHAAATVINGVPLPSSAGVVGHAVATFPGPPGGFRDRQKAWITEIFAGENYPRALMVEQVAFGVLNSELAGVRRTHRLTAPTLIVSALPRRRTPVRIFWDWKQRRYAAHLAAGYRAVSPARHYFVVHQPRATAGLINEFADHLTA